MMAAALGHGACFNSDTLNFGEISSILTSKLTDDDITGILLSIDAVNTLKVLKLIGCDNISGVGLEPLRGSSVLEQIDLSTSLSTLGVATSADLFSSNFPWRFALSEDTIVPILDSIIGQKDRSLKNVIFPPVWRKNKSAMLTSFMERYNLAQSSRICSCSECGDDFQGSPWLNDGAGSKQFGLHNYVCYACTQHLCDDCNGSFCNECQKKFCDSCCPTQYCDVCGKASCMDCSEVMLCENCDACYCFDCHPVHTCECCDRTRCMDCVIHNICVGCGDCNCGDCACEHTVQWCEFCEEDSCNECRLEAYKAGHLDCMGCRALLLPRIMHEKDALLLVLQAINDGKVAILSEEMIIEALMKFAASQSENSDST
ncbi:hypothetical protein ACHAWC_000725 [Mediolabrus comicus]